MNTNSHPVSVDRQNLFRQLARFSWLSIFLSIVANMFITGFIGQLSPENKSPTLAVVSGIFAVTGVLAGVIALFGVPRYGRKGLLLPALTGIILWLLLFGLAMFTFERLRTLAAAQRTATLTPAIHTPGAIRVQNTELGFSFEVPEGYEASPLSDMPKGFDYVFVRKVTDEPNRLLLVRRLEGKIRNERLTANDFPPGQSATLTTFNWRGVKVDAFRVPETSGDTHYLTFNVQIPLRSRAVQLGIGGPAQDEQQLKALVQEVLATFDGETNW